ncbi:hypothetical protein [Methanocaldococcus sp.]
MEVAIKIYPKEFLENEVVGNYLILEGKKIRKVRILGYVNDVNEYIIVDGVKVKTDEKVEKEDLLDIIGYPKEDGENKYILAEIVKKRSKKWILLRELEIRATRKYLGKILTSEEIEKKILDIIDKFGELSFEEIKKMIKIPEEDLKDILNKLEERGEILSLEGKYKKI